MKMVKQQQISLGFSLFVLKIPSDDLETSTHQTRLFEDLAVNHVPCSLTQRQHPEQQH